MSIDWVTVLAQIVNFLLLVWLLKRFLYQPVLRGIDEREAEIARRLREADQAKEQARQAELDFLQQAGQFLAGREQELASAIAAGEEQKEKILQQGRQQLEQEQQQWRQYLQQERSDFIRQLELQAAHTLAELLRDALNELAGLQLEQAILQQMPQRVQEVLPELGAAIGQNRQARITTHAPLTDDSREDFVRAMDRLLPGMGWEFVVDEVQSPGLYLEIGGTQLEWTLDSYVDGLQQLMSEQFTARGNARAVGQQVPDHAE